METTCRLDCSGLPCPQPVLQTRDALAKGCQRIEVLVDNPAARDNVSRFGRSQGCHIEVEKRSDGNFLVLLTGSADTRVDPETVVACNSDDSAASGIVYVISGDTMGRGDDELGWALLQTFIQTICEIKPLPEKILFYNGGVRLVTKDSGALEALDRLQEQGVTILACGTCLDFFKLKSAIRVGRVTNMLEIMETMLRARKVVSPF